MFGPVALHRDYVVANNLPPTMTVPGDPDRYLYNVGQWHLLHCLVSSIHPRIS